MVPPALSLRWASLLYTMYVRMQQRRDNGFRRPVLRPGDVGRSLRAESLTERERRMLMIEQSDEGRERARTGRSRSEWVSEENEVHATCSIAGVGVVL